MILIKSSRNFLPVLLFLAGQALFGQSTTHELTELLDQAQNYFPILKAKPLIESSSEKTIQNVKSGYYPQLAFTAQASYQSEVTAIPIDFPGIDPLSKDQYKIIGNLSQTIYDGGLIKSQQNLSKLTADLEKSQIDMEWEKVQEQVIRIYFGILKLGAQKDQLQVSKQDLAAQDEIMEANVKAGTLLESEWQKLSVEILRIDQKILDLDYQIKQLATAMTLISGVPVKDIDGFRVPALNQVTSWEIGERSQLKWYRHQKDRLTELDKMNQIQSIPKARAFLQGGYGRPALNLLENNFEPFYIAGIQLNWNLSNLYTSKNDKKILQLNQQKVTVQEETYLLQLQTEMEEEQKRYESLEKLILEDEKILDIRQSIKETAQVQMDNGVINVSDYLREFNAEELARITRELHQIRLIETHYLLRHLTGNLNDYGN